MAIPFLNHLDLRSVSELQNAILHKTTTATASNVEGKFLYDTGTNTMQYYNGTAWINLDGTDTGITSVTLASGGDATSGNTITANGTLTLSFEGAASDYVNGEGDLVPFPTIPTVPSNIVETVVTTNGNFIDLTPTTAASGDVTITADLSATGTPDATVYLRGDNAWEPISAIPGTYTWTVGDGTNSTAVASGETVTFSGTANEIEVAESSRTVTIGLPDDVTITNDLTVGGTGDFTGQVTIPILPVASTDAASKDYVDNAVVGGLVYQGGFDGSTGYVAGTTDYLDSRGTQIAVSKGWTYTVTVAGTFYGENVEVGDVLIAEDNLASGTGTLGDWTTVQNNVDLASLTQVGIGNVNEATAAPLKGLSVTYAGGTATAGLDISGLTTQAPANNALAFIPFYDQTAGSNLKVGLSTLAGDLNEFTSKAFTISDTDTITHGYNTRDVIVQLYDTATYETVYADVDRISTAQVTITFATTPANDVRVLVQKIG